MTIASTEKGSSQGGRSSSQQSLMHNGDIWPLGFNVNLLYVVSRALLYTQANLKSSVDTLKANKQQEELPEEGSEESESKPEG